MVVSSVRFVLVSSAMKRKGWTKESEKRFYKGVVKQNKQTNKQVSAVCLGVRPGFYLASAVGPFGTIYGVRLLPRIQASN